MATNEAIVKALAEKGWATEPLRRGVSHRIALARADGTRLVLEDRGKQLWLWIIEGEERRCIALEPTRSAGAVAQTLLGIQDKLTRTNYLQHYTTLGGVAQVNVVAWEKIDPMWA